MNPFEKALSTKTENSSFETEVREWLKMGSELKQSYVANLLGKLEVGTRIVIASKTPNSTMELAIHLDEEGFNFIKACRDKQTSKFVVYRKGKNKLTLVRKGIRFLVTSI